MPSNITKINWNQAPAKFLLDRQNTAQRIVLYFPAFHSSLFCRFIPVQKKIPISPALSATFLVEKLPLHRMLIIRQQSVSEVRLKERNIQPERKGSQPVLESAVYTPFLLLFICPSYFSHLGTSSSPYPNHYHLPNSKHTAGLLMSAPHLLSSLDSAHSPCCVLLELLLFTQSRLMNGNMKHSLGAPGI